MQKNLTIMVPSTWLAVLGLPEHQQTIQEDVVRVIKAALFHFINTPELVADTAELRQPASEAQGPVVRVMFSLPTKEALVLNDLCLGLNLTIGPTAKRIVGLMVNKHHKAINDTLIERVDDTHPTAQITHKINFHYGLSLQPRPAQASCYDDIWDSLTTGHIGLVEAGTGIGKTRAMLLAAIRWTTERKSNIGVCAPTIVLLRQFQAEYDRLSPVIDLPPIQLIMGRREFVSELNLLEFLGDNGSQWDTPVVRNWLKNGFDPASQSPVDAWQMHALLLIAPEIPTSEVSLLEVNTATDNGYKAYRRQFEQEREPARPGHNQGARKPSILLFTHAMLAQDMRRKSIAAGNDETYQELQKLYFQALAGMKGKKRNTAQKEIEQIASLEEELGIAFSDAASDRGILPIFTSLLVDEAHLLEESFSNSLSEYLSIRTIVRDLIHYKSLGGKVPKGGIELAQDCLESIGRYTRSSNSRGLIDLKSAGDLHGGLHTIAQVCEGISKVRDPDGEKARVALRIRRAAVVLRLATGKNLSQAFFQHSPIRHYPRIFISPTNVAGLLSRLWSSLDSGALVSATLYLANSDGPSGSFMANLLKVPIYKQKTFAPIYANWSASCVQGVCIVNSKTNWLCPPQQPTQGRTETALELANSHFAADESRWHGEVAQAVHRIWQEAAGGVLVLCTSYATVEAVAIQVREHVETQGCSVIEAIPDYALRLQSKAFLQASHQGKRPLWIAVGSAWTGVDIGGHDPWQDLFGDEIEASRDNVLTDLVIPRLPYGTNQSLTHLWRIRNDPQVPWDLLDAALRFKQALGRLVRRAGLPHNRRIYILDARIGKPENRSRMAVFLNSLTRYKIIAFNEFMV